MQPLPLPDMCNPTGLLAKMLAGPPLMIGFAWLQLEINCGSADARVHQVQSIGTHHTCDGQVQARWDLSNSPMHLRIAGSAGTCQMRTSTEQLEHLPHGTAT